MTARARIRSRFAELPPGNCPISVLLDFVSVMGGPITHWSGLRVNRELAYQMEAARVGSVKYTLEI